MTNAMVMNKAWEIARKGQSKFGGKVSEYIAEALKMAWALIKKEEKQMEIKKIGLVTDSFKERVLEVAKNKGLEVKLFNGPNGVGHIIISNDELELEGFPKSKYIVSAEVRDSDWNSGIRLIATDSIDEIKDEIIEEKPEKTNEKEEKQMDQVNGFEITERNYTINAWQKYGHKRVYFEGYFIFNDHEVNANKKVSFKGFFDAVNGKVIFQSGQARYKDFIKDVIRDEVNEVIRSMNNRDDNDEGK